LVSLSSAKAGGEALSSASSASSAQNSMMMLRLGRSKA
jgi:hypothetical protein